MKRKRRKISVGRKSPLSVVDEQPMNAAYTSSQSNDQILRTRYGNPKYNSEVRGITARRLSHTEARQRCRQLYANSLPAQALVGRLVDTVVNTGLKWESSPVWPIVAPGYNAKERYAITQNFEQQFEFYATSTNPDVTGRMNLSQLTRLVKRLRIVEGEVFLVVRYLYAGRSSRFSPVSVQILNPDQVMTPMDNYQNRERIHDGIEVDENGEPIAIHVRDAVTMDSKRIPFWGTRNGRQFVIHYANIESPGQYRGYPELDAVAYEINGLTEYDMAELEAANAAGLWVGSVESVLGATPGRGPSLKPSFGGSRTTAPDEPRGLEEVRIGNKALIMNNLAPGYTMKAYAPSRPNPNYQTFRETQESMISTSHGVPHSAFKMKFDASYSASRMEVIFLWFNVESRRADLVAGFLSPLHALWFQEQVASGAITAPGFSLSPTQAAAWMKGQWSGVARPSVDPVKEVQAVETRLRLNHTTGEREAKIYNGSDYQENLERRATEREFEQSLGPVEEEDDLDLEEEQNIVRMRR